jgi:hypothetical protein
MTAPDVWPKKRSTSMFQEMAFQPNEITSVLMNRSLGVTWSEKLRDQIWSGTGHLTGGYSGPEMNGQGHSTLAHLTY